MTDPSGSAECWRQARPHEAAWRHGALMRRWRVPRGHAPPCSPRGARPVPGAVPLFVRDGHRAVSPRGSGRVSSPPGVAMTSRSINPGGTQEPGQAGGGRTPGSLRPASATAMQPSTPAQQRRPSSARVARGHPVHVACSANAPLPGRRHPGRGRRTAGPLTIEADLLADGRRCGFRRP